jgi:hypothetical protein
MIITMIFLLIIILLLISLPCHTEDEHNFEKAVNKFKYDDRVKILDPFYKNLLGTVIGKSFSDGGDSTIFNGFQVKLDIGGKIIITDKLEAA